MRDILLEANCIHAIGRNIANYFRSCGYLWPQLFCHLPDVFPAITVRILDNLLRNTHRALMNLPTDGRYEFYEAGILDRGAVQRATTSVDEAFHLAAVVRFPMSFENPTYVLAQRCALMGSRFSRMLAGRSQYPHGRSAATCNTRARRITIYPT
jgi:hypothetical protein